jgi:hypothetical protein
VAWSGCVVGEGAFVDRCMMADGSAVEPRKSAFSVVKLADGRRGSGARASRPVQALWEPIASALRLATTHQL